MSKKREIKQGEVYMIDLGCDGIGSEEKGRRPCIIVSADELNKNRNNVIVVPVTSSTNKKRMINHYELFKSKFPFFVYNKNTVLCECIRDVSINRIERLMGEIDRDNLEEIISILRYNFVNI